MINSIYRFLSFLLHPIFMMLIGTVIMFNTNTFLKFSMSTEMKQWIYIILAVNTVVLPSLMTLILWRNNHISELTIPNILERRAPYLFTLIFYLITLYMLTQVGIPRLVYNFLSGAAISIFILLILSLLRIKASAHLAGIGGLLGGLVFASLHLSVDLLNLIYLTVFFCGLLASARMKLKAHGPVEVYVGFFIGLAGQVLMHG